MPFRYYIIELYSGTVVGTDKTDVAESFSTSEEHFVVDTKKGVWLSYSEELLVQDVEKRYPY